MRAPTVWPSVTVLLAVAPLVVALATYGPDAEWGTLSSALAGSATSRWRPTSR